LNPINWLEVFVPEKFEISVQRFTATDAVPARLHEPGATQAVASCPFPTDDGSNARDLTMISASNTAGLWT
jgi:hypothetical protein